MNYQKHYNLLIERAKLRNLEGYKERHHIVPRCIGGTDEKDNLVELTAEEHFVAHQLLVKMYPDHDGLKWAAVQMTGHQNGKRTNNKLYGWLKRQLQKVCKQRVGKKNGSYGSTWYHNPETLENIKCKETDEIPEGYIKGRKLKPEKNTECVVCGEDTGSRKRKYCKTHKNHYRQFITPPWVLDPSKRLKPNSKKDIERIAKISKTKKRIKNSSCSSKVRANGL